LASAMSGPIDLDKIDYLQRDSLHAGVPYGQNFDVARLFQCMTRHPETGCLAILDKGRTAAEMMVFARYIMFSEVYWHPVVRVATAMLQRCVFLLQHRLDLPSTLNLQDDAWVSRLRRIAEGSEVESLVEGLFSTRRCLYKRVASFKHGGVQGDAEVHAALARKPYEELVATSQRLARKLRDLLGIAVHETEVIIDAPPLKLEVDINVGVVGELEMDSKDSKLQLANLEEVSPVASTLARDQFDNHVKQVRVFVRDELRDQLSSRLNAQDWQTLLLEVANSS
ncbi:MAG: metal-dependent phosphohydrolase, partial [Planctomycetota bacterium]